MKTPGVVVLCATFGRIGVTRPRRCSTGQWARMSEKNSSSFSSIA
ncbi:MAG: hypothetical protein ACYTGX_00295 [Planctomycetota bacterium]|jgi:hypothetical protein